MLSTGYTRGIGIRIYKADRKGANKRAMITGKGHNSHKGRVGRENRIRERRQAPAGAWTGATGPSWERFWGQARHADASAPR